MRRRNFLRLGAGEAIGGALAPCTNTMAPARATSVLGWNRLALQALRAQSSPLPPARVLAILHTCMYNAWAAYDDDARQTVHGVAVRLPRTERHAASKASAMNHAACLVLNTLCPSQAAFDARMAALGLAPVQDAGQFSPAGIGRAQARSMLDAFYSDDVRPFAPTAPGWATVPAEDSFDSGLDSRSDAEALPLRWCRLAHGVSTRDAYDDDRDVLLYFVLSNALADAGLAGADGGAAAAEVLRSFTGSDRAGRAADGSGALGFSGIAAQDGRARGRAALAEGREVGAQVFDKARRYWQGKL
jgi:hypothetical protein